LGDRLQGAVELASDENTGALISEELRAAALNQVADASQKYDFAKAVDKSRSAKFAICLIFAALLFAALAKFANPALINSISRFFNPFGSGKRFTFTVLENLPERLIVPISEPFSVKILLDNSSLSRPKTAKAFLAAETVSANLDKNSFLFSFAGISEPHAMFIKAGDCRASIEVIPKYRPSIKNLKAVITPPPYIGGTIEEEIKGNSFRVLSGASVSISGEYSSELSSVSVKNNLADIPSSFSGASFKSAADSKFSNGGKLVIAAADINGLEQIPATSLGIEPTQDNPAWTEISDCPQGTAILKDEILEMTVHAVDDYGLSLLAMEIAVFHKEKREVEKIQRFEIEKFKEKSLSSKSEYFFSPSSLKIEQGRLVRLRSAASDRCPQNQETFSSEKYIYVLTDEQHFKLVMEKLKNLSAKIQELRNNEKDLLDKNNALLKFDEQTLKNEDNRKKLSKQLEEEKANMRKALELCEKGAEALKEAMRNNSFSPELMKKWTELFSKLSDIANNDFKKSVSPLENAMSSDNKKNQISKAAQEQERIIKELDKILEDSESHIGESFMDNFAGRLRREAENERKTQNSLGEILKESAGVKTENLSAKLKEDISSQANTHSAVRESVAEIRDDMTGLFKRLPLDVYDRILKDMESEKIIRKMSGIEESISKNRLSEAMEKSGTVAKKLLEWADLLSAASSSSSCASSQSSIQVPLDLVMGLMKILFKENELRKKTKNLEQNKNESKEYSNDSIVLSEEQDEIIQAMSKLSEKYSAAIPQMKELLARAASPMTDAEILLGKCDTGQETVAAETEAIEILSAALSSMNKNSAMLSMMGAMLAGNSPGLGMTGGSDTANTRINGDIFNADTVEKSPDKTFSASEFNIPERFRHLYESYLKRIEERRLPQNEN
jgi:hypothetical protein